MKFLISVIMLTGGLPEISVAQSDSSLSFNKAIEIAEQYIRVNGFTSEDADTTKISYESFYDDGSSKSTIAARRKNKLHPKAFCRSKYNNEWHIEFLSTTVDINKLTREEKEKDLPGKVVIISKDASEIRMAHKDPLFSKWIKLEN